MVECAALEMRFTGNRNVGSNPTLSASHESKTIREHPKKPQKQAVIGCDPYVVVRIRAS